MSQETLERQVALSLPDRLADLKRVHKIELHNARQLRQIYHACGVKKRQLVKMKRSPIPRSVVENAFLHFHVRRRLRICREEGREII